MAEQYFSHVCFMSQQCIEKSFKGYLLAKINKYPRTHSLRDLLGECINSCISTIPKFLPDCLVIPPVLCSNSLSRWNTRCTGQRLTR